MIVISGALLVQRVGRVWKRSRGERPTSRFPGRGVPEQSRSHDNAKYDPLYFTRMVIEEVRFRCVKIWAFLGCFTVKFQTCLPLIRPSRKGSTWSVSQHIMSNNNIKAMNCGLLFVGLSHFAFKFLVVNERFVYPLFGFCWTLDTMCFMSPTGRSEC